MILLRDLFLTDYGFMSIAGIIFMIGMVIFLVRFFNRKMIQAEREEAEREEAERARTGATTAPD